MREPRSRPTRCARWVWSAFARRAIKVLARGEVTKALTVQAHKFSGKAAEKIAAAGGTAEVHRSDCHG